MCSSDLLDERAKPTRQLAKLLKPLASSYDDVFLDCPPSMSLLSENVLRAADVVLVPLIPTTLSLRTMDQLREYVDGLRGVRPSVLGFYSMVDRRKRLHRDLLDAPAPAHSSGQDDLAQTYIPSLSIVEQMAARRIPVTEFAPRSVAAQRYRQLWAEAQARVTQ